VNSVSPVTVRSIEEEVRPLRVHLDAVEKTIPEEYWNVASPNPETETEDIEAENAEEVIDESLATSTATSTESAP